MGSFTKAQRQGMRDRDKPLVTLRESAFAFNAAFVGQAHIDACKWVSIYYDDSERRIGFEFHNNNAEPDKFAVTRDGGPRSDRVSWSRVVQANSVINQHDWIRAVAKRRGMTPVPRRFTPEREDGRWVIRLCPAFEKETRERKVLPSISGIYQLLKGDEIVYIGQGNIRGRVADHERDGWLFDRIKYSGIDDQAARQHWEAYWLDRYEEQHGVKPRYNAVGGKRR